MPEEIIEDPTGLSVRLDDLTKIHNPLNETFIGAMGGIEYPLQPKETRTLPRHLCRHIAKHLCDKILQEKYRLANTWIDTAIRKKVMAQLLPEEVEEHPEKKVTDEQAQKSLNEELDKADKIDSPGGKFEKRPRADVKTEN